MENRMIPDQKSTQETESAAGKVVTLSPGERVPRHSHKDHLEVVIVLEGKVQCFCEGISVTRERGEIMKIPRFSPHHFFSEGEGQARFLMIHLNETGRESGKDYQEENGD